MTQGQRQTQDAQNAQQREYPASAGAGNKDTQRRASGDDSQTDQLPESWRPNEDTAIEQAGGTTQTTEGEPGRSQQDGRTSNGGNESELSRDTNRDLM
jgi:hypothetical protein